MPLMDIAEETRRFGRNEAPSKVFV